MLRFNLITLQPICRSKKGITSNRQSSPLKVPKCVSLDVVNGELPSGEVQDLLINITLGQFPLKLYNLVAREAKKRQLYHKQKRN